MSKLNKRLKSLIDIDKKIDKLPPLTPIEKGLIESEQRFEATYYSNKLEGNKLSKDDARRAISAE